jgi:trehalose utilization protein
MRLACETLTVPQAKLARNRLHFPERILDDRAMENFSSRLSGGPHHGISRRAVLELGAAAAVGFLLNPNALAAAGKRRVVVWSEGTAPKDVYPRDINGAVAEGLKSLTGWEVVTANLSDPDQGLNDDRLNQTDVLIWWGHKKHGDVAEDLVNRIERRVKEQGMGFIALHSAHFAKPYKKLMGTRCSWREYKADGTSAKITVKTPDHPIVKGVKDFELPKIEFYGEPFIVPTPEAVPLDGVYTRPDGKTEPCRMGLCWTIGKGRVFYFVPGHETYDDFFRPEARQILINAVQWAVLTR